MAELFIEKSYSTPKVQYDDATQTLTIEGRSFPEDAVGFFQPVIGFLSNKENFADSLTLNFYLSYISSASIVSFYEILKKVKDLNLQGGVEIIWKYDKEEEVILQAGEKFSKMLEMDIKFHETEE